MYVERLTFVSLLCATAFFLIVSCYLTIALIAERSKEVVRITVTSEQLLGSIGSIQSVCDCKVQAIPLDGEEDTANYWRITWDGSTK